MKATAAGLQLPTGGIVELVLGVDAAGKSLEEVAAPLTEVRDAGAEQKRPATPPALG